MCVMQSGTQMVKLKAGSKGLVRLFYLDEHRSCIRWKPSRKSEKAKSEYAHAHAETCARAVSLYTVCKTLTAAHLQTVSVEREQQPWSAAMDF